ncbi:MAG: 3-deoxy-D-manno-octulosonic acid transferase [Nitrospiraceae bacterium]|nr:3-deoxy-D-manno-octulosonic acid transferase [Nitrospiraceae bacterium]
MGVGKGKERENLLFLIYTVIYFLVLPFFLPREISKRPKGARRKWFSEKLGFFDFFPVKDEGGAVWVHAVSVGEVMAAAPFIEALNERGIETVISTITDTGRKVARTRFPGMHVLYLPFDLPCALGRAANRIKPRAFVLMETELWPNAIKVMSDKGVPVFIVNGRLSESSAAGYRRLRFFFRRVLSLVALMCVQDEVYAARAVSIGAEPGKVAVTGNFKFEMKPSGRIPFWLEKLPAGAPVIVAGSTHKGEEGLIISVYKRLRGRFPGLRLVLAPRHPERVSEVEEELRAAGLDHLKSSEACGQKGFLSESVIVVDTVGELFRVYSRADAAIVGGSFSSRGGQNPLEPAYWGKPVICGPDMRNFPFMGELLKAGGALMAREDSLLEALEGLLADEGKRAQMGGKAREFYLERSGAVQKTVNAMLDHLKI